ncbi:MAG TPA: rod shape-determining protein MreC [Sporosarcina sp.]|nr:rod shape-determining protein MreC [Sporosarcina sp.]
MPRFFSNKRLILLLVGVIVLVALISFSLKDRHNASLPERIVKDVVGFGQTLFSKPAHFVTDVIGNIDGILNTYDENKILKERLNEYASLQAELTEVQLENEQFREIIDKQDDLKAYDPIHATVISRNPDQWEERVIIDKGKKHGVKMNMAVITARGLVGKVISVTDFHSTVELLTTENRDFRVSAVVRGNGKKAKSAYGLIESYDQERGELLMKKVDTDIDIKVGENVVSSGLGGIFPKGLPIGTVTEVSTDDYGLTKLLYIKPAAQFSMLDHVIIASRTSETYTKGSDGSDEGENEEDES